MCGITGSLSWKGPDQLQNIQLMTEALKHRGPDAQGVFQKGPIIFGHRRLSIIDLDPKSNQPFLDPTEQYVITYNGELYNYKELKEVLRAQGVKFRTQSDTEVILEAFKVWGSSCVHHFVGMFAFAIWDAREQTLFIARDRMGEKPLFFTPYQGGDLKDGIIFSSELKGLLLHPHVKKEINPQGLSQFLAFNYLLTDACIFKNIYKLPPAHFLTLKKNSAPRLESYWDLKTFFLNKNTLPEEEAMEKLRALFTQSIQGQLMSNVPLGAFLSGGIDSSAVTKFMGLINPTNSIQTFSIGFQEKTYSELPQSIKVAELFNTSHHTKIVEGNLSDKIEQILRITDEPFADTSLIPTYFLAEFARSSVTVALSGDGGDELFGGYETYIADKIFLVLKKYPHSIKQTLRLLGRMLPLSFNKVSFHYKLNQFLKGCDLTFQEAHCHWRRIFDATEMTHLFQEESLKNWTPYNSLQPFFDHVKECDPLDQAMYVDMKTWLVDDILVKVDRASMAHSLEVRAPFLDHRLVEFAASLPSSLKIKRWEKKYLLKKMMRPYLPKSILYQKKRGFNAPLSSWLHNDLKEFAYETTTSRRLEGLINLDYIKTLWNDHTQKKKDNGLKLFGILALGVWAKETYGT